jgi:hypothetical protein
MTPDPVEPYVPIYLIGVAAIGIGSWVLIRSRATAKEKKKWADRAVIVSGVFVIGFSCFMLVMWKHYFWLPIAIGAGVLISYLNIRNTFYCDRCGKRSFCQIWFSDTFHCPHCGNKLR